MTKDPTSPQGDDAVARFVAMLRATRHVPVNYISADERIARSVIEKGGSTEEQLQALVAQAPAYRWSEMAGRLVVLPRSAVWDTRIDDVVIADMPRLEAATRFVSRVRAAVPELEDLAEPPMIGDPRSPVYSEAVSLPRDASILEHLVALLGANVRTIFTIERAPFGERLLHFDRIGA